MAPLFPRRAKLWPLRLGGCGGLASSLLPCFLVSLLEAVGDLDFLEFRGMGDLRFRDFLLRFLEFGVGTDRLGNVEQREQRGLDRCS